MFCVILNNDYCQYCRLLAAALLSLWHHWFHAESISAPQQPLQVAGGTTITSVFSYSIVYKLEVETIVAANGDVNRTRKHKITSLWHNILSNLLLIIATS